MLNASWKFVVFQQIVQKYNLQRYSTFKTYKYTKSYIYFEYNYAIEIINSLEF